MMPEWDQLKHAFALYLEVTAGRSVNFVTYLLKLPDFIDDLVVFRTPAPEMRTLAINMCQETVALSVEQRGNRGLGQALAELHHIARELAGDPESVDLAALLPRISLVRRAMRG